MEVQIIKRRISPEQSEKRATIVRCAAEMIAELGSAFSMEALAEASSTSRSTLYRYFTSREHLIAEVTLAAGYQLIERLQAMPMQGRTVGENIQAMCLQINELASHNQVLLGVCICNLASEDPAVIDTEEEIEQLISGMISSVLGKQCLPNANEINKTIFRYLLGSFLLSTSGKLSFQEISTELIALCQVLMQDSWEDICE